MFWKLIGSYGILTLVAVGVLGALVANRVGDEFQAELERSLRIQTLLLEPPLAPFLTGGAGEQAQQAVRQASEQTGARVTLIDATGEVIADSEGVPNRMANHLDRPEIQAARENAAGSATRWSASVERNYLYLAQRVDQGGETLGYLRLAAPTDSIVSQERAVRAMIWGTALAMIALSAAIAWLLARQFWHRLADLGESALAINRGDYDRPIDFAANDEIGALGRSLHRMRSEVRAQIIELERGKREFQTMLETIPEGVIAIDADERILFANPSIYRLFGLTVEDRSRHKFWEILRHPGLQAAVAATFAGPKPYSTEFEIFNPPKTLEFRGRTLPVGFGRGIIMVLRDMTELRRLERLRQEFFANVSHELKTPLAAIKAFTETLLDGDVDDRETVYRFLTRIEEQAERLHALVIDMLMLARVESQDHGFDIQPVDLAETLAVCRDSYHEEAASKHIDFRVVLPDEPRYVLADAEGLATILSNLIDNAIKYTPDSGKITVSTSVEGPMVSMSVADTGVGIPPEDLTRVFERFYRVDKARSRELGGTGLGLSIVKHLAQTFGGSVHVASRVRHGSTFTVWLPLISDQAAANAEAVRA